jgi:hypothetical protein
MRYRYKFQFDSQTFTVIFELFDVKFVPLSVMILCGTPKRKTIDLMKLIAAVESWVVTRLPLST